MFSRGKRDHLVAWRGEQRLMTIKQEIGHNQQIDLKVLRFLFTIIVNIKKKTYALIDERGGEKVEHTQTNQAKGVENVGRVGREFLSSRRNNLVKAILFSRRTRIISFTGKIISVCATSINSEVRRQFPCARKEISEQMWQPI